MIYDNLKKNTNNIKPIENKVIHHFVQGPYVEIKGDKKADYKVEFIDNKTGRNSPKNESLIAIKR